FSTPTPHTAISTLSLHDALPICRRGSNPQMRMTVMLAAVATSGSILFATEALQPRSVSAASAKPAAAAPMPALTAEAPAGAAAQPGASAASAENAPGRQAPGEQVPAAKDADGAQDEEQPSAPSAGEDPPAAPPPASNASR